MQLHVSSISLCATSLAVAWLVAPPCAGADESATPTDAKQACVQSFDRAQTLRAESKLVAAEQELIACSQPHCPAIITSRCSPWLDEVTAELPSIVVAVKDGAGNDITDVRVRSGGKELAASLDGRPIVLDPGVHELELTHGDEPPLRKRLVVAVREKGRRVELRFGAEPSSVGDPGSVGASGGEPGVSPLVYVGFGVAGAGLIVGSITGGIALAEASSLEEACGGTSCTEAQRGDFDRGALVAHVSTVGFAVAGAGAVLGVVGLFVGGSSGRAEPEASKTGLRLSFGPGTVSVAGWLP